MKNNCTCKNIAPYYLRLRPNLEVRRHHHKKQYFCVRHTDCCSDLYEGNIETRVEFKSMVERLNNFNKLNRFIRASRYYSYCLEPNGFYHNSRTLCNACYEMHPNISKHKIVNLLHWLYRSTHQRSRTHDIFTDDMNKRNCSKKTESDDYATDYSNPGSEDESEEEEDKKPNKFTSENNILETKHGKKIAKQLEINMLFWAEILN